MGSGRKLSGEALVEGHPAIINNPESESRIEFKLDQDRVPDQIYLKIKYLVDQFLVFSLG